MVILICKHWLFKIITEIYKENYAHAGAGKQLRYHHRKAKGTTYHRKYKLYIYKIKVKK